MSRKRKLVIHACPPHSFLSCMVFSVLDRNGKPFYSITKMSNSALRSRLATVQPPDAIAIITWVMFDELVFQSMLLQSDLRVKTDSMCLISAMSPDCEYAVNSVKVSKFQISLHGML